jgi:hypothetical protein
VLLSSGNVTPQEIQRNIDVNKINNVIVNSLNQVISNTSLKVVHQNIRGLRNKYNELYCHLSHDLPHIICMSEHHLKDFKLQLIHLSDYTLGAK